MRVVDSSDTDPRSYTPREEVGPGRTWGQSAQNRFWTIVPILALDLALISRLPPPLAPGNPGPGIPGWVSLSETVLRDVVMGAPLLMPLSLRAPSSRPALAVYSVGLAAYVAAWVAVVWAPTSPFFRWPALLLAYRSLIETIRSEPSRLMMRCRTWPFRMTSAASARVIGPWATRGESDIASEAHVWVGSKPRATATRDVSFRDHAQQLVLVDGVHAEGTDVLVHHESGRICETRAPHDPDQ